jgi:flavin reductase (DIM6/NTAB) family NADH-FMN oxidoreductase RutF
MAVDIADFTTALRQYASGVCLLTVRDDLDDVGTTVTSVMSVSAEPPLVAVGLTDGGYPVEVLESVGRCALTVLGAQHAIVASRFASHGRPSARHLLDAVPWARASGSGAIVLDDAPAALDCRLERLVPAGDHVLALLVLEDVPVLNPGARPLLRLRGRYVDESGHPLTRP